MRFLAVFGLFFSIIACESRAGDTPSQGPTKNSTMSGQYVSTATTGVEFDGLLFFTFENETIGLSYTDQEEIVHHITSPTYTLTSTRCLWTLHTRGWEPGYTARDTSFGETIILTVVFRPDGERPEDADVRVYADGHRLATTLVWETRRDAGGNIRLGVETNTRRIRRRY